MALLSTWETRPYPPAHGDFAVYTIDDLVAGVNFAVQRYYNAEKDCIGFYERLPTDKLELKIKYFWFPGLSDTEVMFTDLDNNGQVNVELETLTTRIRCSEMNYSLPARKFPDRHGDRTRDLPVPNQADTLPLPLIPNPATYTPSDYEIPPRISHCHDICGTSDIHGGFFTLGANVTQPENSPTAMGFEPETSRFQIRQTLYRVAIKASSYSKAV
ncbi:hypothetical protein DPMN_179415 [Dreissena polymorpha]|uniref:Uncharacterized protein n=1 Tax=Dreissena polymorpha TaxID=45954 RepID=A0A9D4IM50_DREPO|nr:hypothetical protein DPMN_179415 [Dreissena polymorpha]